MRKICVITGTRADYGILSGLLKRIVADPELRLQLVATAMHLIPEFGSTYQEIEKDGFTITEKIPLSLLNDTYKGASLATSQALAGVTESIERLKPDIMVLLGDRMEMLAAATAALLNGVPIAHIHGGEVTCGAFDDAIRHAITKMALIHFPAAEAYKKRIIQMGESPERVFCVGALGLENIKDLSLLSKSEFEESIKFKLGSPTLLITYHPVTLEKGSSKKHITELLTSLDMFPQAKIIFTYPNSDPDNAIIRYLIENYVSKNSARAMATTSLGQIRYLSALKYVDVVIGNSSSGLIEVPAFQKPTVNIGDRQKGRLMADSVLCCDEQSASITQTIKQALDPEFRQKIKNTINPYEGVNPSSQILNILKNFPLDPAMYKKNFYDLL